MQQPKHYNQKFQQKLVKIYSFFTQDFKQRHCFVSIVNVKNFEIKWSSFNCRLFWWDISLCINLPILPQCSYCYTFWNCQKTKVLLTFSGSTDTKHCAKMGQEREKLCRKGWEVINTILYCAWSGMFDRVFLMQLTWSKCCRTLERGWLPAGIYLLKINNRNTRTKCEIAIGVVLRSLLLTLSISHTLF